MEECYKEEFQSYVSNEGIKWSFILEMAPWTGGFYERLVGLVKRAMGKTIQKNLLTVIQLQTILKVYTWTGKTIFGFTFISQWFISSQKNVFFQV